MKSTKLYWLASMAKYTFNIVNMMVYLLVIKALIYKKNILVTIWSSFFVKLSKHCLNFFPVRIAFLSSHKIINFLWTQDSTFFNFLCFCIYIMFDSEYSIEDYISSKINSWTIMENLEMLKLVPDHLATEK